MDNITGPIMPDNNQTQTNKDDGNLFVDHQKDDNKSELLRIRKEALDQLAPLVDRIEQTPLEKFHTTMMMIQASDDQSLISSAYESAKKIEDEKQKAEALLDVINEINYFTGQKN